MAFPVTCPACGKAFQLATEIYERKVAGKIVSIKCKQCQAGIRVDATKPGELRVVGATTVGGSDVSVGPKPSDAPKAATPAAEKPQAAPVRMRQPTLIGMVNPLQKPGAPVAPPRAPQAPAAPVLWAVDSGGGGDDRELDENEIRTELEAGRLTLQTLAWREGMAEWLEIEKIPELRRFLDAPREQPKPAPAAEKPVVREPPREHASFQDEPDAEATQVYDRSAPNAAFEPFAAPGEDKTLRVTLGKTAPLDAPPPPPLPAAGRPAAFAKTVPLADQPPPPPLPPAGLPAQAGAPAAAPTPPAPPAARPAPPAQPAPPAPVATLPVEPRPALPKPPAQAPMLAAVPWGDPLPSAKPAAPALPTAPYGPDPFAIAATTDLDFPSPRSKAPLIIAAVVGVVAVVGIVIALTSSSSPPVVAAPPPVPTTPSESPKVAEPTEPKPANEPSGGDLPGSSTPGTQPQPQSPSGNFTDLFSKGAEKAKGTGSDKTKGFSEAKAREALAAVLDAAAACKEPGGATGQTTATVTFESSGSVSGVTVGAPFAGTQTGTCVITAFKRAKTAPFSGLPGTVSQVISIR